MKRVRCGQGTLPGGTLPAALVATVLLVLVFAPIGFGQDSDLGDIYRLNFMTYSGPNALLRLRVQPLNSSVTSKLVLSSLSIGCWPPSDAPLLLNYSMLTATPLAGFWQLQSAPAESSLCSFQGVALLVPTNRTVRLGTTIVNLTVEKSTVMFDSGMPSVDELAKLRNRTGSLRIPRNNDVVWQSWRVIDEWRNTAQWVDAVKQVTPAIETLEKSVKNWQDRNVARACKFQNLCYRNEWTQDVHYHRLRNAYIKVMDQGRLWPEMNIRLMCATAYESIFQVVRYGQHYCCETDAQKWQYIDAAYHNFMYAMHKNFNKVPRLQPSGDWWKAWRFCRSQEMQPFPTLYMYKYWLMGK